MTDAAPLTPQPLAPRAEFDAALLGRLPRHARRLVEFGCGDGLLGALYLRQNPAAEYLGVEDRPDLASRAGQRLGRVLVAIFDPTTEQGPQVDKAQFDKILQYVEYGKKDGAKCVTGGQRHGSKGYFVEPTLFANVTDDMRIAREEIFGPVMSALKFKNVDEIIKRSNDTTFGLAAAVWTRDVGKAHRYASQVRAGTVWVNCYDVFDAAAPFGGFKESGLGRELGEAGLDNYTESKTVTVSLS